MKSNLIGLVGQRKADRYKLAENLRRNKNFVVDILHEPGLLALVVLGADNVEAVTNLARGHRIKIAGHDIDYRTLYDAFFNTFGRKALGFNIWLALALTRWKSISSEVIVVPDIESTDEAEAILKLGGEIVWIKSSIPTIGTDDVDWEDYATATINANQTQREVCEDLRNLWPNEECNSAQ